MDGRYGCRSEWGVFAQSRVQPDQLENSIEMGQHLILLHQDLDFEANEFLDLILQAGGAPLNYQAREFRDQSCLLGRCIWQQYQVVLEQ